MTDAGNAYVVAWRKFGESIVRNEWDAEKLSACTPPRARADEIALFYEGLSADYYVRVYLIDPNAFNLERLRRHIWRTRNAIETFTQYAKTSNHFTKDERDALEHAPKLFEQFVGAVVDIIKEPL